MVNTIPVLDAACMTNGDIKQCAEFGHKFLESLTEYGFVKLVNHSVPLPIVEDTFSQVCLRMKKPYDEF